MAYLRSRRFRPQISLRLLCLLVAAFAVWLGIVTALGRTQAAMVKTLRAGGGECYYGHQCHRVPADNVFMEIESGKPSGIRGIAAVAFGIDMVDDVVAIAVRGSIPDEDTLKMMAALPKLEELHLSKSELTPTDISALSKFGRIRVLFLQLGHPPAEALIERLTKSLPNTQVVPMVVSQK